MHFRILLGRTLLACGLIALATPASAQIFTWRDADGRLVLSNQPPGPQAEVLHSFAVQATDRYRTTQKVSSGGNDRYDDIIVEHARRNGVRDALVRAVIQVESAFNPGALSPKGAMGLMQLMPATARELGVRNAFNPEENVQAGVKYLRQLLDRYNDDEALALAAYNAGPGAVDRHGQNVPPFRETQAYVVKVNKLSETSSGSRTATSAAPAPPRQQIYRRIDIIDGRPVVSYSDRRPDDE